MDVCLFVGRRESPGRSCPSLPRLGLPRSLLAFAFLYSLGPEVYIGSYGWLACVVGILAASLGCCVCCRCCRPMRKERLEPEPLELSELPVRSTKLSPAVPVLVMGTPSPKQARRSCGAHGLASPGLESRLIGHGGMFGVNAQAERAPVAPPPTPELPDCALRSAKLSPAVPVLVMGTPSPKQAREWQCFFGFFPSWPLQGI